MPQKMQPAVESGGTCVTTQASNANKHPGTEVKKPYKFKIVGIPKLFKPTKRRKEQPKKIRKKHDRLRPLKKKLHNET